MKKIKRQKRSKVRQRLPMRQRDIATAEWGRGEKEEEEEEEEE